MHRNKRRRIEKSLHAYKPVYMQRNQWRNFQGPRLALVHLKKYIFANNSKPLGLGHFRQFSTPPNPILPTSDLVTTKLLRKFQIPTTPGGRDSSPSVCLSVRSDFSVSLRARKLKFCTKDAYVTVSIRVKQFFDRTTLRPSDRTKSGLEDGPECVRSDFSVPLRARKLKFCTKDAYVTNSRRVKRFFDRFSLRPTIGPIVAPKVGRRGYL